MTLYADQLEWEEPPPVQVKYGRVQEFVDVLRTRPEQWARYPHPYSSGSVRYMVSKYPKRYVGTEWCSRRIEGELILYARWVGQS